MKILALIALFLLSACTSTPELVVKAPVIEVQEKEGNREATLVMTEKVYNYAPNSTELKPQDKKELLKIAKNVAENLDQYRRIEIVGHSDQTGTEDLNLDISKERAITVLELFKEAGIERKMIRTSWLAGTEPIDQGSEESLANRRVEIRFFELK